MTECPRCGGDLADVLVFTNAGPISQACTSCGWNNRIMFVRWRGEPAHVVDPRWNVRSAVMGEGVFVIADTPVPVLTVHCGPPADRPQPPTPEEILTAAGLR